MWVHVSACRLEAQWATTLAHWSVQELVLLLWELEWELELELAQELAWELDQLLVQQ